MDRTGDSGLEVKPSTDPQVAGQPDENKYYIGSERLNHPISYNSSHPAVEQPNQSNDQSEVKGQSLVKAIGVLIIIVVLLLAVALGAGLGVGLSAQHKQPRDALTTSTETNNAPITVIATNNAPVSARITRVTATKSSEIATVTPTQYTLPSRACPVANASTYTATNKPFPTASSQISDPSLRFEVLCDTDYIAGPSITDLQLIANVSTLNDCFDLCALYDFRMQQERFPEDACTGVSWGYDNDVTKHPRYICWLKNGLTLRSSKSISPYLGYDSGILLLDI